MQDHGHHNHQDHDHDQDHQDKNSKFHHDATIIIMLQSAIYVVADAFVSLLVMISLGLTGHVQFIDPLVALIGAFGILSWSWDLIQDPSLNLLGTLSDRKMVEKLREKLMSDGTRVDDLHVWRLGPSSRRNSLFDN